MHSLEPMSPTSSSTGQRLALQARFTVRPSSYRGVCGMLQMPFRWVRAAVLGVLVTMDLSISLYNRYGTDEESMCPIHRLASPPMTACALHHAIDRQRVLQRPSGRFCDGHDPRNTHLAGAIATSFFTHLSTSPLSIPLVAPLRI